MKVFYSWQTDSPSKINRYFILSALEEAQRLLAADIEIEQRPDGGQLIEIDHDTKGVLGAPLVANTIFEKISKSDIVVLDVSLVAKGERSHINSNVAIEAGYTLGSDGQKRILNIMNTAFGPPADLPFDLPDRRHPTLYNLEVNASQSQIKQEKKSLAAKLVPILKAYLSSEQQTNIVGHDAIQPIEPGKYWEIGDAIVPPNHNWPKICHDGNRFFYIRIIPTQRIGKELSSLKTYEILQAKPIATRGNGQSYDRNRWGAVAYSPSLNRDYLLSWVQLFRNGEIWFVDPYLATISSSKVNFDGEFIPAGALRKEYPSILHQLYSLTQEISDSNSFTMEIGLVSAEGLFLAINDHYFDRYPGPLFSDIVLRRNINDSSAIPALFNEFMNALFSEAGAETPDVCKWFTD